MKMVVNFSLGNSDWRGLFHGTEDSFIKEEIIESVCTCKYSRIYLDTGLCRYCGGIK